MCYEINIYDKNDDNTERYALGFFEGGTKCMVCIGVNPSKANELDPDPTVRNVVSFARDKGCNSWIMLNLYPLRATNFQDLPQKLGKKTHTKNLEVISRILKEYKPDYIYAGWGNLIKQRSYLFYCLREICEKINELNIESTWVRYGDLTNLNNPRHPSPQSINNSHDREFHDFDIASYLDNAELCCPLEGTVKSKT